MKESLLNKVTVGRLEELHDVLCAVINEIKESQPNERARFSDEDYVKCVTLAAKVRKVIADKSK